MTAVRGQILECGSANAEVGLQIGRAEGRANQDEIINVERKTKKGEYRIFKEVIQWISNFFISAFRIPTSEFMKPYTINYLYLT